MLTIIDVSAWQGEVDWSRVAADGIRLAFIKATEGTHFTDPRLARNRAAAAKHGVRVGFYHFAAPDGASAAAQADHFCKVVGRLGRRELRPVLDLESGSPHASEPFAREWNRLVHARLHVWPIFYSYPAYIESMGLERTIGAGLWLASYGRNDGEDYGARVPAPWRKWIAHQYTSGGRAAGIAGPVDFSHAPRLGPLLAHPVTGRV